MRLTGLHGRHPHDGGFTLVELLVAIAILGIITVPLGNVIIGFVSNTTTTSDRLALSHDAQISAAYFARDVASMGVRDYTAPPTASGVPYVASIQLNAAYNADGKTCGSAATPVAAIRFLSDDWDGAAVPPAVHTDIVAYYLVADAEGTSELHRIRCTGSGTPGSDAVVAHNVVAATVAVTCSSGCTAAAVPQLVTLRFTVTQPAADPYQIVLTGQRRQT